VTKLILNTECNLYERGGQAYCTSRQIANEFDRRHPDILRIIYDKIESAAKEAEEGDDLATQFCTANFVQSQYSDRGKRYPEFLLTRSGFSFIAMGLTGRTADRFKILYINRFEAMEEFILSLNTARLEHPAFTDAIHSWAESRGKEAKAHHFINEADMINRIVLGVSARQFREERGIPKGESIRPHLSAQEVKAIEALQRADIGLLMAITEFEDRKAALKRYFERMKLSSKLIA